MYSTLLFSFWIRLSISSSLSSDISSKSSSLTAFLVPLERFPCSESFPLRFCPLSNEWLWTVTSTASILIPWFSKLSFKVLIWLSIAFLTCSFCATISAVITPLLDVTFNVTFPRCCGFNWISILWTTLFPVTLTELIICFITSTPLTVCVVVVFITSSNEFWILCTRFDDISDTVVFTSDDLSEPLYPFILSDDLLSDWIVIFFSTDCEILSKLSSLIESASSLSPVILSATSVCTTSSVLTLSDIV